MISCSCDIYCRSQIQVLFWRTGMCALRYCCCCLWVEICKWFVFTMQITSPICTFLYAYKQYKTYFYICKYAYPFYRNINLNTQEFVVIIIINKLVFIVSQYINKTGYKPQFGDRLHHYNHHVPEGLDMFPVPRSSKWSWSLHLFFSRPMFLRPFGLYRNACFGILSVSILCTCCSHFFWYCFISSTKSCAPVFPLILWFFSLSNFVIPSKCLKNFIYAASKRCSFLFFSTQAGDGLH